MTTTKNIAAALVKAQMEMGPALKQSNNPHFRSKYADLGNVMEACMPALQAAGIAVIQPTGEDQLGKFVETVFIHAETGETLACRTPLLIGKNDMQGYGSAVTYARRYGLMAMAGIAPEDDDGNAAVKAAPKQDAKITADQFQAIQKLIEQSQSDPDKLCAYWKVDSLESLSEEQAQKTIFMLSKKLEG